jgi:hypothetical protein
MRSPVADLLADLAAALTDAGVPWYLFGAQAAILHGSARLTADVDVTVRLAESMSHGALATQIERHGFERRIADRAFVERTQVIPFVHRATSLPLDVVVAGPGIEDQFFERVVTRDIEGVGVRLASVEDVVVMKVLAGRPKDLDDVHAILCAQGGTLDATYIRNTLGFLEEALGQSDLRPTFEQAVTRARP